MGGFDGESGRFRGVLIFRTIFGFSLGVWEVFGKVLGEGFFLGLR